MCPYNASHRLSKKEFEEHITTCPTRNILESEIYSGLFFFYFYILFLTYFIPFKIKYQNILFHRNKKTWCNKFCTSRSFKYNRLQRKLGHRY